MDYLIHRQAFDLRSREGEGDNVALGGGDVGRAEDEDGRASASNSDVLIQDSQHNYF